VGIDDVPRSLLCVLQAVAAADQVFPARNALIYIICHEFGNALDHARPNDVSESNFSTWTDYQFPLPAVHRLPHNDNWQRG